MPAALRHRHRVRSFPRLREPLERHLQHGRQHLLPLHREHQPLGQLIHAPLPRLRALHPLDPLADLPPHRLAQPRDPLRQCLFGLQQLCQLRRHLRHTLLQVGGDAKSTIAPTLAPAAFCIFLFTRPKCPPRFASANSEVRKTSPPTSTFTRNRTIFSPAVPTSNG